MPLEVYCRELGIGNSDPTRVLAAVEFRPDGKTIVTSQTGSENTLWVAPAGKLDAAVRVAGESVAVPEALSNGRALFTTGSGDHGAIWSMAADGSDRQRLSPERLKASQPVPAALADVIVFTTGTRGTLQMWRMDLDGSRLAEVPDGARKRAVGLSPDGKTVYFRKNADDPAKVDPALWRMPMAGGPEERVGDTVQALPRFSPDGRYFYRPLGGQRGSPGGGRGRGGTLARQVEVFTSRMPGQSPILRSPA